MRRIGVLDEIPRDDEFHFKRRASALVQKWQDVILASEKKTDGLNGVAPKEADVKPAAEATTKAEVNETKPNGITNGVEKDADMSNVEAKEESAASAVDEKKDEPMDMSDS